MDNNKTLEKVIQDNAGELETMKVLQLKLARTIDESNSGRDIAALSRQLREVTAKISELEQREEYEDTPLYKLLREARRPIRDRNGRTIYQEGQINDEN